MLSGITLIIALLLIPHMISYISVFISNMGNWCGTPEATSWGLLWTHWLVLFVLYRHHRAMLLKTATDSANTRRLMIGNLTGRTARLILIVGVVVLLEPMIITIIMNCGQPAR